MGRRPIPLVVVYLCHWATPYHIPQQTRTPLPPTMVGLCFGVPLPPSQQGSTNQCWPFTGNRMISFRKAKIPKNFAPAAQPPPPARYAQCVCVDAVKQRTHTDRTSHSMMGPRAARKLPHYGDTFWHFGMWARAEAPHAYAAQSYRRPVADTRRAGGSPFLASPALQLHLRALSRARGLTSIR